VILLSTSVATILAFAGQTSAPAAQAPEKAAGPVSLQQLRDAYSGAQAMRLSGEMQIEYDSGLIGQSNRDEASKLIPVARLAIQADWASPGWGMIDYKGAYAFRGESMPVHFASIGTKLGAYELDHDEETFDGPFDTRELKDPLASTFPFSVMLRGERALPLRAQQLASHPKNEDWNGWSWETQEGKVELWLAADQPQLITVTTMQGDLLAQRVSLQIRSVELEDEADAESFLQRIPTGYEQLDLGLSGDANPEASLIATGAPVPDFEMKNLDGSKFRLSEMRGKTVLLYFWSSREADSLAGLPQLEKLAKEVAVERDDLVILCVNSGDQVAKIQDHWDDARLTLQAVRQSGNGASKRLGVQLYPTSYLISSTGKILYRGMGFDRATLLNYLTK